MVAAAGLVAAGCGEAPAPPLAISDVPGTILYADDFSDTSSGWPVETTSGYQIGYGIGELGSSYEMEITGSEPVLEAVAPGRGLPHDVRIDLRAEAIGPAKQESDANVGISCRYGSISYVFQVGAGGYFGIYKYRGRQRERTLVDSIASGPSAAILGPPSSNRLSAVCTTSDGTTRLGLTVNSTPVAAGADDDPAVGHGSARVGLRLERGHGPAAGFFYGLAVSRVG